MFPHTLRPHTFLLSPQFCWKSEDPLIKETFQGGSSLSSPTTSERVSPTLMNLNQASYLRDQADLKIPSCPLSPHALTVETIFGFEVRLHNHRYLPALQHS